MLSLFSSKADHPLGDSAAFERALSEWGQRAPEESLRAAAQWLETLAPAMDTEPAALLRVISRVDEVAQPHARALCEAFVSPGAPAPRAELWALARHFWTQLAERYEALLHAMEGARRSAAQQTAEVCVRLIRASGGGQRWDALHYGPYDPRHWQRIGHAYLVAQRAGLLERAVRIRSDRPTDTTTEREYTRAVALATAALDELDEVQIELAWRMIHFVLPSLLLSSSPATDSVFWIDPASGKHPARMVRPPPPQETLRYFSGGRALDTLLELEALLRGGVIPPAIGVSSAERAQRLGPLLHHLLRHWSAEPPVRRHRRHPLAAHLHVVEGLEQVADQLSGAPAATPLSWEQIDASLHGVGAHVPLSERHPLQVGTLLGLRSVDGDRWLVGMVRRIQRAAEARAHVGVELLSWNPLSARADDGAHEVRVLLLDPLQRGASLRVVIPLGLVRTGAPLYLLGHNKALKLSPAGLVERGVDCEIRSYQASAHAPLGS